MTSELLNQAVALIKTGNMRAAVPILKEVIQTEPSNEIAWLWLYSCVDDSSQKKVCLEKALEINLNNRNARSVLNKLIQQPVNQPVQQRIIKQSSRNTPKRKSSVKRDILLIGESVLLFLFAVAGVVIIEDWIVRNLLITNALQVAPSAPCSTNCIVFASNRDGNYEIYTMGTHGDYPTRLTRNNFDDYNPAWSPDGQHIVFETNRDRNGEYGNYELYVMDANGSNPLRLTTSEGIDSAPAWSLNGRMIAFTSQRNGHNEIYVMNADGSNQTRLTVAPPQSTFDYSDQSPSWSPDGKQIVFDSTRDGGGLYLMNANGSNQGRLTMTDDRWPAWSPDGQKIAFISYSNGHSKIYIMDTTGSRKPLETGLEVDGRLAWSPDGQQIAFSSYQETYIVTQTGPYTSSARAILNDLYVINIDGSGLRLLTKGGTENGNPAWRK